MNTYLNSLILLVCLAGFITGCQPVSEEETMESSWAELPIASESDEAVAEFTTGLAMVDAGFSPNAYDHFKAAIDKDPDFVTAHVYAAWFAPSSTEFGEHLRSLEGLKEKANDAEEQLIRMTQAQANGDYGSEHQAGLKLVALYPESPRAHAYLGFILNRADKTTEARAEFEKAVELAPDWVGGHSMLADSYMFNEPKDLAAAQLHAEKMVELEPDNAATQILIGDTYRAQHRLDQALTAYEKAASLDPDNETALMKAGHAETFMAKYDEARSTFQKAAEIADNPMPALNYIGFTYLYEGDYDKAKAYLNELAENPEAKGVPTASVPGARMGLHWIRSTMALHNNDATYLEELNQSRAQIASDFAATIGTDAIKAYTAAGVAYWEAIDLAMKGDYEGTLAKAEEHRQLLEPINDPTKLQQYNFLMGYLGLQEEDYENAVEHFKQTELDNIFNKYMLAYALEKSGNTDEAMALYQEVADYNFNNIGYALVRDEAKGKVGTEP